MNRTAWILIGLFLIVVVGGGLYAWDLHALSSAHNVPLAADNTLPALQNVSTSSGPSTLPSSGTTNADLSKDLSSIDAQLSGLSSDNQTVNQSLASQTPATN